MLVVLCSLPSEPTFFKANRRIRSEGELPVPPKMAIVSLVKYMLKTGVDESEYDFYDIDMLLPDDNELFRYFSERKPDMVGLSAVTSGAYTQVKRVAQIIRNASPNTWVVLGGNLAASANVILRKTEVNLCVVGDGEIAWSELIKHYRQYGRSQNDNLRKIAGVAFLEKNGDLFFQSFGEKLQKAELEYIPDYEILKKGFQGEPDLVWNYFRPGKGSSWFNHDARTFDPARRPNVAVLWASKGCPVRCTFCQRPTKGYRALEIERYESEIQKLVEEYDVGFVFVGDESFGSDHEQAREFAVLMKKYNLLWGAGGVRCDSVTRDDIKFFAENNCVALKFGVESGSQKILDVMEKRFRVSDVEQAVKWCAEFKLFSPLSIMLGMPGETEETVRETARYIARLAYEINKDPFSVFGGDVFYAIPFPGTPLYEYGQHLGVIGASVDEEEKYLEGLFSAPTYKMSYINLNGAEVRDVLVWEIMVAILVRKEHARLVKQGARHESADNQIHPRPVGRAGPPANDRSAWSSLRASVRRRLNRRDFSIPCLPYISNFFYRTIVRNGHFMDIPEPLLFFVLKTGLYIEYLLIRLYAVIYQKDYYKYASPRFSRNYKVEDNYHLRFPTKKIVSLRNIVVGGRRAANDVTEQSRVKLLNGL